MAPKINKDGVIMTLNNMGHCIPELTEFSQAFVDFSKKCTHPVLDIGAAYGPATIAALKENVQVVANDMEARHLAYLQDSVEEVYKKNLTLKVGRIPDTLSFEANFFCAIHVSQVLHFLNSIEIEQALSLMYQWLVPGGKIFIVAGTPYMSLLKQFIPIYENRKAEGDPWPGQIMNMADYCSDPEFLHNTPSFMNFLDPDVLTRVVSKAGFIIEDVRLFKRKNMPSHIALDGRENVGLIGKKPS